MIGKYHRKKHTYYVIAWKDGVDHQSNRVFKFLSEARAFFYEFRQRGVKAAMFKVSKLNGHSRIVMTNTDEITSWREKTVIPTKKQPQIGWSVDRECTRRRAIYTCTNCLRFENGECFKAIVAHAEECEGMDELEIMQKLSKTHSESIARIYKDYMWSAFGKWADYEIKGNVIRWKDNQGVTHVANTPTELEGQISFAKLGMDTPPWVA